jgi:hypothetical protein
MPNPIQESGDKQSLLLFAVNPIRILTNPLSKTPKPSLLQFGCKDDPAISDYHAGRPAVVFRYCPASIKLYSELAS